MSEPIKSILLPIVYGDYVLVPEQYPGYNESYGIYESTWEGAHNKGPIRVWGTTQINFLCYNSYRSKAPDKTVTVLCALLTGYNKIRWPMHQLTISREGPCHKDGNVRNHRLDTQSVYIREPVNRSEITKPKIEEPQGCTASGCKDGYLPCPDTGSYEPGKRWPCPKCRKHFQPQAVGETVDQILQEWRNGTRQRSITHVGPYYAPTPDGKGLTLKSDMLKAQIKLKD